MMNLFSRRRLSPAAVAALAAAVVSIPTLASAQTIEPRPQQQPLEELPPPQEAAVNNGNLNFEVGSTFTTAYYFRGYLQEDDGLIAQPYATVSAALIEAEDEGDLGLSADLGIWNSFHSENTGATGDGPNSWYEADFFGGLTLSKGAFSLGVIYTFYEYPSGSLDTIEEVGFTANIDGVFTTDEDASVGLDLGVGGGVYFEVDDKSGPEDIYAEVGASLGVAIKNSDGEDAPFALSFPVVLGFSIEDYYVDEDGDNDPFGYVSVGGVLDVPINVADGAYGDWLLSASIQYLFLASEGLEAANGGNDSEIIGSLGISVSY